MKLNIGFANEVDKVLNQVDSDKKRRALEDSLQLILNSTAMGYSKRQAPDGSQWAPNPSWYAEMKGQDSPLTGPITSSIKEGELAGVYKFKKVNTARMKNSLIKTTKSDTEGVVEYDAKARERASINQYGGKSEMVLIPISTSTPYNADLIFNIQVVERPHLGVATYPRIGDKTDAQWVEFYFGEAVEASLQEG